MTAALPKDLAVQRVEFWIKLPPNQFRRLMHARYDEVVIAVIRDESGSIAKIEYDWQFGEAFFFSVDNETDYTEINAIAKRVRERLLAFLAANGAA